MGNDGENILGYEPRANVIFTIKDSLYVFQTDDLKSSYLGGKLPSIYISSFDCIASNLKSKFVISGNMRYKFVGEESGWNKQNHSLPILITSNDNKSWSKNLIPITNYARPGNLYEINGNNFLYIENQKIYFSMDFGENWQNIQPNGIAPEYIEQYTSNPGVNWFFHINKKSSAKYLFLFLNNWRGAASLYRFDFNLKSWRTSLALKSPISGTNFGSFQIQNSDCGNLFLIYTESTSEKYSVFPNSVSHLMVSDDLGINWEETGLNSSSQYSLATNLTTLNNNIFLSTYSLDRTLFKDDKTRSDNFVHSRSSFISDDCGSSWKDSSNSKFALPERLISCSKFVIGYVNSAYGYPYTSNYLSKDFVRWIRVPNSISSFGSSENHPEAIRIIGQNQVNETVFSLINSNVIEIDFKSLFKN
ncbi:MAG TPA: hypothetical protein VK623_09545 [Flavobacterium sp.]|nr:hypothetical protein [Flavobacterium sp.]